MLTDIRMPPTGTDEGVRAADAAARDPPEPRRRRAQPVRRTRLRARAARAAAPSGRAYLLKERVSDVDQLVGAIREVAARRLGDRPARSSRRWSRPARAGPTRRSQYLTPRESEVLAEMAQGRNNAAVAAALGLSERAVEKHINSVFSKLGLSPRSPTSTAGSRPCSCTSPTGDGPGGPGAVTRSRSGWCPHPGHGRGPGWDNGSMADDARPRPDRRRSGALPPGRARGRHRHARVRGGRRGRERRGGRRAGRRRSHPGLVLMDINLPGINGIEATRRITAAHPEAVVMLLSTYQADDLPADAATAAPPRTCTRRSSVRDVLDVWTLRPSRVRPPAWIGSTVADGASGIRPADRACPRPGADSTATCRRWRRPGRSCSRSRGRAARRTPGRSRRRSSATSNSSAPSSSRTVTVACAPSPACLRRVLQRLEAAEVDRGLDGLRVAADALGLDVGGQRGAARGGARAPRRRPRSMSSGG